MIYIYWWAENQIFKILFFSNTDTHRFLRLYSLIECLEVNRMYVTRFWFHSKLVLEKAKKPACYELAIHVFFLNILNKYFKRKFCKFQMNILADFIPIMTKSSITTRKFISQKLYIKQNILANNYSRKLFS